MSCSVAALVFYHFSSSSTTGYNNETAVKTYNSNFPGNWKSYSGYGLRLRYPSTWSVQELETKRLPIGFTSLVYITKPNLSNDPSAEDEPTKNVAMIEMRLKSTTENLQEIVDDFKKQFGFDIQLPSFIKEEGTLDGHKAYYIYQDIGNLTPVKATYPTYIIFMKNSNEVFLITIDFYDLQKDLIYSKTTVDEINKLLSSIEITE